jgi:hypothetical protein
MSACLPAWPVTARLTGSPLLRKPQCVDLLGGRSRLGSSGRKARPADPISHTTVRHGPLARGGPGLPEGGQPGQFFFRVRVRRRRRRAPQPVRSPLRAVGTTRHRVLNAPDSERCRRRLGVYEKRPGQPRRPALWTNSASSSTANSEASSVAKDSQRIPQPDGTPPRTTATVTVRPRPSNVWM